MHKKLEIPFNQISTEKIESSITAIGVAMAFATSIFTKYDYIFDRKEAYLTQHLCQEGMKLLRGKAWVLANSIPYLPYSWQQAFFNSIKQGYGEYMVLRKLMIKQKIEQSIKAGIQQIVILGGGYDIRGLITALAHPQVHIYEIDRGSTRQSKLKGLQTIPSETGLDHIKIENCSNQMSRVNHNMHYIEADLSVEDLGTVLDQAGFQQQATLFIAEGLAMYIDQAANQRLMTSVHNLMQPASEFLISHINKPMYSKLSKDLQTTSKELLKFTLPLEEVINYMGEFNLEVTQKFSPLDSLNLIYDKNAKYYADHPEEPREYYYILKKAGIIMDKNIYDVPTTTVVIPEKPSTTPSYCQIL